jgi:hypothetical protein
MTQNERRPADNGAAPGTTDTHTVHALPTVGLTPAARRVLLHHRLRRHRRYSRELDRLLVPPDPWTWSAAVGAIDWDDFARGVVERDRGGRELLAAGWSP